ncbi:hypothetical protein GCM10027398_45850 [Azotobacter salinestris]
MSARAWCAPIRMDAEKQGEDQQDRGELEFAHDLERRQENSLSVGRGTTNAKSSVMFVEPERLFCVKTPPLNVSQFFPAAIGYVYGSERLPIVSRWRLASFT